VARIFLDLEGDVPCTAILDERGKHAECAGFQFPFFFAPPLYPIGAAHGCGDGGFRGDAKIITHEKNHTATTPDEEWTNASPMCRPSSCVA